MACSENCSGKQHTYWNECMSNLSTMRNADELCDVSLFSDEGMMYKAHSCILAANSSVFYAHFVKKEKTLITEIAPMWHKVTGMKYQVLRVCMEFIYGFTPVAIEDIMHLKEGAVQLHIASALHFLNANNYIEYMPVMVGEQDINMINCSNDHKQSSDLFDIFGDLKAADEQIINKMVTTALNSDVNIDENVKISENGEDGQLHLTCQNNINCNIPAHATFVKNGTISSGQMSCLAMLESESAIDYLKTLETNATKINDTNELGEKRSNNVQNFTTNLETTSYPFQSVNNDMYNLIRQSENDPVVTVENNEELLALKNVSFDRSEYFHQTKNTVLSFGLVEKALDTSNESNNQSDTEVIKCGNCKKSFLSQGQLCMHLKQCHKTPRSKLFCPDCEEIFKNKPSLKLHQLKVHNRGELFTCSECSFKTPRKKDLKGHLVSRHGKSLPDVKVYQCQFCDYRCVDKCRYQEHAAKHKEDKVFKCDLCDNTYSTKRGLRNHMNYHSQDRPHTCDICQATFKVRSKLRDHLRLIHTRQGEKPFKCGHCDFHAAVRGNTNQHIRNMHKGQPIVVIDTKQLQRQGVKQYDYSAVTGSHIKEIHGAVQAT